MPVMVTQSGLIAQDETALQSEAAYARVQAYSVLAHLLRQAPNADLLDRLIMLDLPDSDPAEPDLARAWRHLRDAAAAAEPAVLNDVFHDLFVGLGRGEVLPYASWYLSGALMDRPLVAVRSDLARLGVIRREDNREPEDHAAALFETMALLADPAAGVATAEQRHFLLMHIAPWASRFFADIDNADSADDFYRAVAALGAALINVEQSWLSLPA